MPPPGPPPLPVIRTRYGATSTAPPTHSSPNSSASATLGANSRVPLPLNSATLPLYSTDRPLMPVSTRYASRNSPPTVTCSRRSAERRAASTPTTRALTRPVASAPTRAQSFAASLSSPRPNAPCSVPEPSRSALPRMSYSTEPPQLTESTMSAMLGSSGRAISMASPLTSSWAAYVM